MTSKAKLRNNLAEIKLLIPNLVREDRLQGFGVTRDHDRPLNQVSISVPDCCFAPSLFAMLNRQEQLLMERKSRSLRNLKRNDDTFATRA